MTTARYILAFAGAVCLVCAVLVSGSAVALRDLQAANAERERQRNVLFAAGLADPAEDLSEQEMAERFAAVRAAVVDLETGAELPDVDPASVDPLVEAGITDTSRAAPENLARVRRVERRSVVYLVEEEGRLDAVVLPVRGQGLWSVLYGYLARTGRPSGRDGACSEPPESRSSRWRGRPPGPSRRIRIAWTASPAPP